MKSLSELWRMAVGAWWFGAAVLPRGLGSLPWLRARRLEVYQAILEENVSESGCQLKLCRSWVRQLNTDFKQWSKSTTEWLLSRKIHLLERPSVAPAVERRPESWSKTVRKNGLILSTDFGSDCLKFNLLLTNSLVDWFCKCSVTVCLLN